MGKRKEGQSYLDVSRKSYDTSDRPMPNLTFPANSLDTRASAEACSCIFPSPSPSIPPSSQMRLLSPCSSLSTSPCPSSIHSSSSKLLYTLSPFPSASYLHLLPLHHPYHHHLW
nr:hypothetical protein I308_04937 [Cryptococcus tetragattii IND107]